MKFLLTDSCVVSCVNRIMAISACPHATERWASMRNWKIHGVYPILTDVRPLFVDPCIFRGSG